MSDLTPQPDSTTQPAATAPAADPISTEPAPAVYPPDASTVTPATADAPAHPEPAPAPAPEAPVAPEPAVPVQTPAVGSYVRHVYESGAGQLVQHGLVVAVDHGLARVAWFTGVSGPLDPASLTVGLED